MAKGKKERNDYTGPIDLEIDLDEFSKDFLFKLAGLWKELYEAQVSNMVMVGAKTEGVGPLRAASLECTNLMEVAPPIFRKLADLCKVDKSTIEGKIKSGKLIPDDLTDRDPSTFSKEWLLKVMRLWGELWELHNNNFVKVGGEMEEVGPLIAANILGQSIREVAPPVFRKIAEICKVDINTIEGRMKAGRFIPDNLPDHYIGAHLKVISGNRVEMTYDRCYVVDKGLVGNDINVLRYFCDQVEPQFCIAYMNYPGEREVKIKMLKVPECLPPKKGEPICHFEFVFED